MPRPMTRRPLVPDDAERDDPDALLLPLDLDDPDALRALFVPPFFDLLLELPDALLELPRPPLALIPPLLFFGMSTPRVKDCAFARTLRAAAQK
jgi:hypothetical protein